MFNLILKPVFYFLVLGALLFAYHIYGPALAQTACPLLDEPGTATFTRCTGFFNLLG